MRRPGRSTITMPQEQFLRLADHRRKLVCGDQVQIFDVPILERGVDRAPGPHERRQTEVAEEPIAGEPQGHQPQED